MELLISEYISIFLFVFIRIATIIIFLPIFGSRNVPLHMKIGLAFLVSIIVMPVVSRQYHIDLPDNMLLLTILIGKECSIGFIIGYVARLIFSGIQIAGYISGFQMGFGIVNVVDPNTSAQVSVISEIKYILAVLIFFSIEGHHMFFRAIVKSFEIIPLLSFQLNPDIINMFLKLIRDVFILSIKICAPVMAALLFTNVGLGLIARTVPQINIFIIGFPLQIAIGLMVMSMSIPFFCMILTRSFANMERDIYLILGLMK